jgi:predicted pyridoxine 5'-phosphate oxidase superfamily flavin-nucleotide-binding protein
MATLTQAMKDMIATQQCFIATVDKNGIPNIAPKRSTRVLDDHSLIFTEGTGKTTFSNIKNGSKVAVGVVNRDILDGYRFIGTPEIQDSGEIYELAAATSQRLNMPKPLAVVIIHINEIYSLKPGPTAGMRIE